VLHRIGLEKEIKSTNKSEVVTKSTDTPQSSSSPPPPPEPVKESSMWRRKLKTIL
jgi:hypothetical protein